MTPGGIRAGDQKHVADVDVVVRDRYRVFAEGLGVRRDRRRHTQSGIRIDVCGAEKTFREFVYEIVFFGQQLTRYVKSDRVRSVAFDQTRKNRRRAAHRLIPGYTFEGRAATVAHLRIQQAIARIHRDVVQVASF